MKELDPIKLFLNALALILITGIIYQFTQWYALAGAIGTCAGILLAAAVVLSDSDDL